MIISPNGWSRLKDVGWGRRWAAAEWNPRCARSPSTISSSLSKISKMYSYHLDARNHPDINIFIIVIIVIEAGSGSRWEMMLFPAKSTHNLLVTVKAHIKHIWKTHTNTNTSWEVRHSDTNKTHLEHSDTKEHTLRHSDTNKNTSGDTQTQTQTHLKTLTQTKTQKHIETQINPCADKTFVPATFLSMTVIKTHRKWNIFPLLDNYCHRFWRCFCQLDAASLQYLCLQAISQKFSSSLCRA